MHDPYGTPHPDYDPARPRFVIYVGSHDPDDEPGWTHKLCVVDNRYQDSEGFPIDSIAAGDSWAEAFVRAGEFVCRALDSDQCIF